MKGTEKIIAHIKADGSSAAENIINDAKAKAEQIKADSFNESLAQYQSLVESGKAECEDIISGSRRIADMEAGKSVLAEKQAIIDEAFAAAAKKITGMPRDKYTHFLSSMAAQAASNGTEEIVLNAKDKAEVGKAVCKQANDILSAAGKSGKLTLSEDTADIEGGVIIRFGGIETNCSIDALIRQRRSALVPEVAAVLFG